MNSVQGAAIVIAGLMFSVATPADAAKRYFPEKPGAAPFSQAVLADDTLYVAGMLGLDPNTGQAPADPKVEIRLVMDSVKRTVESAGFKMDDIVNVQIFCTDLSLYDAFNEIYRTYFTGRMPARAFIGTDKLLRGARFEVIATAEKDD